MILEFESEINAPIEKVFEFCTSRSGFLAQFPYKTKWIKGNDSWDAAGEYLVFYFKVMGVNINYETEIVEFEKNKKFIDIMRVGPYKYFRHEHHFIKNGDKTTYKDILNFSFGVKGMLDKLIAGPMTKKTFKNRHKLLKKHFQKIQ